MQITVSSTVMLPTFHCFYFLSTEYVTDYNLRKAPKCSNTKYLSEELKAKQRSPLYPKDVSAIKIQVTSFTDDNIYRVELLTLLHGFYFFKKLLHSTKSTQECNTI